VFIDEVSFNPRHVKFHSWVPKENPDYVIQHQLCKSTTAISALTDQGLLISELRYGTNTSREIFLFLVELEKKLEKLQGKGWTKYRQ
jgi:hypothetical protein